MDLDTQPLMTRMLNNECVEREKKTHASGTLLMRFIRVEIRRATRNTSASQQIGFLSLCMNCKSKQVRSSCLQVYNNTHNSSWVIASNCDVLRPGGRCQSEDEDEHRYNEQHHRHNYRFPLSPLK